MCIRDRAIAEGLDSQTVDEVTLITAKEQLNLDEDAFIKYSKEGKVAVNSCLLYTSLFLFCESTVFCR